MPIPFVFLLSLPYQRLQALQVPVKDDARVQRLGLGSEQILGSHVWVCLGREQVELRRERRLRSLIG